MGMMALRLGGWLLPSFLGRLAFEAELVGGLAVFAGYVIFDSQVRRPQQGRRDVGGG
jgi:hypothetical protein